MIPQLKEILNNILWNIEMDDNIAVMQGIVHFTVLFSRFLNANKDYIFMGEIQDLNHRLNEMLGYVEQNDLAGIKEITINSFVNYLDNWDFKNKPIN